MFRVAIMAERHFIVDFETRSPLKIGDVGMFRYMELAEPLCVCWKEVGDEFVESLDFMNPAGYESRLKTFLKLAQDDSIVFHAHNAQFEMLVFYKLICPRFNIPRIHPKRFRCTAAACRQKALPGDLLGAGEALELLVKKDNVGKKSMLRLSVPKGVDEFGMPEFVDPTPEEMKPVIEYCIQDVLAEEAIYEIVGSLPHMEQEAFLLDWQINSTGVPIDQQLCKRSLQIWELYQDRQNKRIAEITNGEITSYTQPARIPPFVAKHGIQLAGGDAESIDALLDKPNLPPVVKEVLEIRRKTAKTSIAKFSKMLEVISDDGRAKGCHIYHGASTGRWAGALIQLQNIARGKLSPQEIEEWIANVFNLSPDGFLDMCDLFGVDPGDILSSLIRSAIATKEGKFLICDYAGIEARGVAWLAGQDDLVKMFRERIDIYKIFAGENIYNVPIDRVNKDQRFVGKQAILGCGYGMGAQRFREQCAGYGVTLQEDFCSEVINAYRVRFGKIKIAWGQIEQAAVNAVKTPGKFYACNRKVAFEQITIKGRRFLTCLLPSKRMIFYPDPDLEPGRFGNDQVTFCGTDQKTRKWTREQTYGGKLTENIVQAICRDLLTGAMFRLREALYDVVMHVHDEIVCEVPARGDHSVGKMAEIMKITPKWAEGFPIEVEGFEARRYRK